MDRVAIDFASEWPSWIDRSRVTRDEYEQAVRYHHAPEMFLVKTLSNNPQLVQLCRLLGRKFASHEAELAQQAAIKLWTRPKNLSSDWSMRFNGVIFHRLSLVRIYLGQDSGQVLQYKCTLSLYFTITVQSKVCALLVAGCCIFV